ncbi:bifunctional folylpolyglutamate synthase and dihydrofolate synthase [Tenacibaculum maritimum]|nr:bifunctional folylpolyglutamate synthase and dihydrofolate synthase [Tenacibaculum maritimum]
MGKHLKSKKEQLYITSLCLNKIENPKKRKMTYKETVDWMFSRLPMYQRQGEKAFKKDLTNIKALTKELNFPEKSFKSVHIGGTNGKGSTSHMIASVLQEAGYKVGLYTSPHLKSFTERIKINGLEISEEAVVEFVKKHKHFLENQGVSFFEMTVGMAFQEFSRKKVDIAVIEVGLGGRLDSTNIIIPEVSVITNIGLDHTQFLGDTLPEIALEKAGIIKKRVPVVIGEKQEEVKKVFLEKANKEEAKIFFASDQENQKLETDLLGNYQKHNVKTAIEAIKVLKKGSFKVSEDEMRRGLINVVKNTKLKGRWQILKDSPKVVCDTAHNKEGLNYVLEQLKAESYDRLHIVLGVVSDKKIEEILPMFPKEAIYYFCKPNIPRGMPEKKIKEEANKVGLEGSVFDSVNQAYSEALKEAKCTDLVYIGGSTFVVSEIL